MKKSNRIYQYLLPIFISSLWFSSCGFPTHFSGNTGKVGKKGSLSIMVGSSIYAAGTVKANAGEQKKSGLISTRSDLGRSVSLNLPREILSPEVGLKWVFLKNTELQFHSNILATQRVSIRHQIIGDSSSNFAGSIGLGFLRNQIESQKIMDLYLPINFSWHTSNQKFALYAGISPMLRSYDNLHRKTTTLDNYYFVNFEVADSRFIAVDLRGGLSIEIDKRNKMILEIGSVTSKWGEATQASIGFITRINK